MKKEACATTTCAASGGRREGDMAFRLASLAAEGAAPERWQPIFDGLDEVLAPESGK